MKITKAAILAAGLFLLAGRAWGVTIDGSFTDWTAVPIAWNDPVGSPFADSTNDFEYRGLGSADFAILQPYLGSIMDIPPLPDAPFAEEQPGPENELDVQYVQHLLEGGTLFIRVKMADGVVLDVSDTGSAPPSAISATEPFGEVAEQSIYDILIDIDPGRGTGFTNDFTFTGAGPRHFSALDGADFMVEVTDPMVPGFSAYQLYRYIGDGRSFAWEWVAEVQGAMDGDRNSFEIAVPLKDLQVTPVCGGGIGYALVTSDSEDWWGDDLVPGYLGEVGASYWYVDQAVDWWMAQLPAGLTKAEVIAAKRYLSAPFDDPGLCETSADPRTQGYWWRQATSLDLITGYHGKEKKIHPEWTRSDLQALFLTVDPMLAFSGQTTAQALWANPENSQQEKSLKQYAALLLNVNSGRLSTTISVDLGAWGLGVKQVGQVVSLLREKWIAGQYNFVNDVADSINTGMTLVP